MIRLALLLLACLFLLICALVVLYVFVLLAYFWWIDGSPKWAEYRSRLDE